MKNLLDSVYINLYKHIQTYGGNMKKLLITLTDKLHEELKAEKRRTGASMAEIVRRAVVKYLYK